MQEKQIPLRRAHRRVHLRGADAELPGRERHERSPPRRGAGGGARRPVGRGPVCLGRAARAGPPLRRRRADRARPQHHQHGARHVVRRLRASSWCCASWCPAPKSGVVVASGIAAGSAVVLASIAFTARVRDRRRGARRSAPCSARWSACTSSSASVKGSSPRSPSARCWRRDPTSCTAPGISRRHVLIGARARRRVGWR